MIKEYIKSKSKKGFLLRDLVISAILFSGVIALFVIVMGGVATNYDRPDLVSDSFAANFNKLNQLTNNVEAQRQSVSNSNGTGMELQGNFDVMFGASWGVISLIWSTLDIYANMGTAIVSQFTFIPQSVLYVLLLVLISALVAYLIFSLISSILRGRI